MSEKEFRVYFGKRFYKQKDGYWANIMPIHAHRWVWINHYGSIPKGMDIHHKDGNKSNNEIENLEALTRSDHLKRHWEEGRFDLRKRKEQLDKARPLQWLKSEEGKKIISEKGKEVWAQREEKEVICENCGNEKKFKRWARFCSKNCYMNWRHKNKVNFIEFNCSRCGKVGRKARSKKTAFCSIACARRKHS